MTFCFNLHVSKMHMGCNKIFFYLCLSWWVMWIFWAMKCLRTYHKNGMGVVPGVVPINWDNTVDSDCPNKLGWCSSTEDSHCPHTFGIDVPVYLIPIVSVNWDSVPVHLIFISRWRWNVIDSHCPNELDLFFSIVDVLVPINLDDSQIQLISCSSHNKLSFTVNTMDTDDHSFVDSLHKGPVMCNVVVSMPWHHYRQDIVQTNDHEGH